MLRWKTLGAEVVLFNTLSKEKQDELFRLRHGAIIFGGDRMLVYKCKLRNNSCDFVCLSKKEFITHKTEVHAY